MEKNNYPQKRVIWIMDLMMSRDTEYLKLLNIIYLQAIENFGSDFIFYLSGVDIIENDKLGKLRFFKWMYGER